MTFSDKSRYDRVFQRVTRKGGKYAMNYIRIFQNAQDYSVSVGINYCGNKLMHMFLDKFHQGGEYSDRIATQQTKLRREGNFTDQKYLSISSLQTDHLNIDSI